MNMNRLGVLAISLLGIQFLASGLYSLGSSLAAAIDWPDRQLMAFGTIGGLVGMAIGLALLRWRSGIASFLFGDDDAPVGRVSLEDAQVAGIAILGTWMIAEGLPALVRRFVWVPNPRVGETSFHYEQYPVGEFISDALPIAIGAFLMFKGQVLTKLWSRQTREEATS